MTPRVDPRLNGHEPDGLASAKLVGLRYVGDQTPGISRRRASHGFTYWRPGKGQVRDAATLTRIRALVIPPAWRDVWICPNPDGHLQATGRDARGRKQYRYHPRWIAIRDEQKYGRLIEFARVLPSIRRKVRADLRATSLSRERVLAVVVTLLERTLIRVGNDEYARANGSYGLTTMQDRHARVQGGRVRFRFRGKSGVFQEVLLEDPQLARSVRRCQELPGQTLFQYVDEDRTQQTIDSADVNDYLRSVAGDDFTAKDFRTWAGTVMAAAALAAIERATSESGRKKNVVRAIETVAARLGNTKAVCRKCYVHPAILEAYQDGTTIELVRRARATTASHRSAQLSAEERAVVVLLKRRLRQRRTGRRRPARDGGEQDVRLHGLL